MLAPAEIPSSLVKIMLSNNVESLVTTNLHVILQEEMGKSCSKHFALILRCGTKFPDIWTGNDSNKLAFLPHGR